MKIDLDRCALLAAAPASPAEHFEAVRERTAPVIGRRGQHLRADALRHAVVECRDHELVDGRRCERCEHLLNAVPSADGTKVLVRCVFFESDAVTTLMTRVEDLVMVTGDSSASVAEALMVERGATRLIVVEGGRVIGLVLPEDLAGRAGPVARQTPPFMAVVPRTMTLAEAAHAMRAYDLDAAVVLDGDDVVGLLTRDDLLRAGVPGV
jgi:CBS domain-containing protein